MKVVRTSILPAAPNVSTFHVIADEDSYVASLCLSIYFSLCVIVLCYISQQVSCGQSCQESFS